MKARTATWELASLLESLATVERGVVTAVHAEQGGALITPDDGSAGVPADFTELTWGGPRVLHLGDRVSYRVSDDLPPSRAVSIHVLQRASRQPVIAPG